MPRDLFEETTSAPQRGEPRDLFAEQQKPEEGPGLARMMGNATHGGDFLKDIALGSIKTSAGLAETPYNIVKSLGFPEQAETLHKYVRAVPGAVSSAERLLGLEKPSVSNKLIQGATGAIPFLAAPGGGGWAARTALGGLYGAIGSESPLTSGAIGAVAGAAAPAIGKGLGKLGEYLNIRPGKLAKQIAEKAPAEYTQELQKAEKGYKNFFDKTSEVNILNKEPSSKLLDYLAEDAGNETHSNFIKKSSIENAHRLKTKVGEELGQLKKIKTYRPLVDEEKRNLSKLSGIYDEVSGNINKSLEELGPEFSKEYQDLTQNWRSVVKPLEDLTRGITKLKDVYKPGRMETTLRTLAEKGRPLRTDAPFQSQLPKEYQKQLGELQNRIRNLKIAKKVGKIGAIGALGAGTLEEVMRRIRGTTGGG